MLALCKWTPFSLLWLYLASYPPFRYDLLSTVGHSVLLYLPTLRVRVCFRWLFLRRIQIDKLVQFLVLVEKIDEGEEEICEELKEALLFWWRQKRPWMKTKQKRVRGRTHVSGAWAGSSWSDPGADRERQIAGEIRLNEWLEYTRDVSTRT